MTEANPNHPAPWNRGVLDRLHVIAAEDAQERGRSLAILDPFAGVGRIHELARDGHDTYGIELEPEWAICHRRTLVGDALHPPFDDGRFDAVFTSPCYGNRLADHHEAKDPSKRHTYRHTLGRPLSEGSAAGLEWGDKYREFHRLAITQMVRVVRPSGLIAVNMKNHMRNGELQRVVEWWVASLIWEACLALVAVEPISTRGIRHGSNFHARAGGEHLIVFRRTTRGASTEAISKRSNATVAKKNPPERRTSDAGAVPTMSESGHRSGSSQGGSSGRPGDVPNSGVNR